MLIGFDVPLSTCTQVTSDDEDDTLMRSWDTKMSSPISLVLLMRVATVSGLPPLVRVSPTLLNVANSSCVPPASMYSALCQAMIDDPLVSHVILMTSPKQSLRS